MVAPMAIAAGLGVGGSILGGKGAKKAAKVQQRGLEQAQNRAIEMAQPYADFGKKAMNPLMAELGIGGGQAYTNPLLAQIQDKTMRDLQARQSASGQRYSGDTASMMAQGMLQPAYQMQQNRIGNLMGMVGMGQNAATQQAGTVQSFASPISGAASQGAAAPYMGLQQGVNQMAGFAGMMGGGGGMPQPPVGYVNNNPMSMGSGYQPTSGYNGALSSYIR